MSLLLILCIVIQICICKKNSNSKCNNGRKNICQLTADDIIDELQLSPLIGEGGYFNETYRSDTIVFVNGINQTASTQIYYLITPQSFSSLHKLTKDEVWHFYLGDSAQLLLIYPDGQYEIIILGNDIMNDEILQYVIYQGIWFGVKIEELICGYSLFGTTVSPGFEFQDFTSGDRTDLIQQFPDLEDLIIEYTYS